MYNILLVLLLITNSVFSANILFISPIASPSHHIWNRDLAFGLANRGHNVTLLGPDKDEKAPANYHHIYLEGVAEIFANDIDSFAYVELTPSQSIEALADAGFAMCENMFRTKGFKQLLNYPSDFKVDLLILDFSMGPCIYPFIWKFNYPPTIAVTAFVLPTFIAYNLGSFVYPSSKPWYGVPYGRNMTLIQRFFNYAYTYGEVIYRNFVQFPNEYKIAKEAFGEKIPDLFDLERHISLVLANTDPVIDIPQHLPPNIIPVGGLHVKVSQKLPRDLQTILDNAKNGVIVFSLGSNVRSDKLDESIQKALLEAFSKLRETVIWKFESDMKNVPANVVVRKWLPQNDILEHPNVKLFIGHGGALSTQEAIAHGVPIICVPFFMDQHINSKNVIERKLGLSIYWKKITSNYVLENIQEVLSNPIYSENVRKVSKQFKDRMHTPLERAIFWAEYAIRHNGADFLNTAARDLPFYINLGFDVLFVFILIISLTVFVIYKIGNSVGNYLKKKNRKLKKQ